VARINERLGLDESMRVLYENATLGDLAAALSTARLPA
jgi:hypothetical protein